MSRWGFLLLVCLFFKHIEGGGEEIAHFESLTRYVQPDTLLVVDIDHTLMEPMQQVGSHAWLLCQIAAYRAQGYEQQEAYQRALIDWEAVQSLTESRAVENTIPAWVRHLQQQGIPFLGLSSRSAGMVLRTGRQLACLGIDLSKTAPLRGEAVILSHQPLALYYQGIVFAGEQSTGEMLFAFLEASGTKFGKVVYLSAFPAHVAEVAQAAAARKVAYVGLHYTFPAQNRPIFRPDIGGFQFARISPLLSDEEAENMIREQKHG